MDSKTATAAIVGAVLIVIVVGNWSSALSAPPDDACSLLTQAQVSGVLGVSMGPGQPISPNIPGRPAPTISRTCGWSQPGATSPSDKRVVLDLFGAIGSLTPADRFANGKTPVKGITKTPVSGVGDDAYYIATPGLGTGLNVKKGSSVFQVRVYGFPPEQVDAMEKTLAQDALAKL